ncbi:hypothetical protein CKN73_07445 [Carnobacterium divergens]|uniref:hypothetical protein n=1 Tax=Carnobacterium divergens TaxID=2748 RepID=UPI0010720A25|nr:hypothetical protein [Carnobacterium divergens]TFJ40148.1 hypothetical protein CKN77_07545 [Carnobacterium divergens]TFJ48769.1 hypothetical protein CKN73_07445 [Carnobacterium divergens]TFJ54033.1 hypothetical protein CKN83_07350 [Carnobacterium divergens]TFJ59559.1 hypothetical protein CKN89_07790 [Carnobacterium divergens]TFJ70203.1 hypothetical protein CKN91_07405 [Carnobacterium divergens]
MSVTDKLTSALEIVAGTKDILAIQAVIEVQKDLSLILEENRELREENHRLKNDTIIEANLEYHEGVYLRGNEVYCAVCWDKDKKLTRVRQVRANQKGNTDFACDICNTWRFSNIPYVD